MGILTRTLGGQVFGEENQRLGSGGVRAPAVVDSGVTVNGQRFYFSGAVSPGFDTATDEGWADAAGVQRQLLTSKDAGEALATSHRAPFSSPQMFVQAISDPLAAQTISGTVKCQMRVQDRDSFGGETSRLMIKVVSGDGETVRGTLLALADHSPGTAVSTSFRNKIFADGDALSSVVAQAGDRLVIEVGCGNDFSGDIGFSIGAPSATLDLAENETTTTALVPWIEFHA